MYIMYNNYRKTTIYLADPPHVLELRQQDFEVALSGFTPASIRSVALHEAGDLTWDDVGGLTHVKNTLTETLLWPSKVKYLQTY